MSWMSFVVAESAEDAEGAQGPPPWDVYRIEPRSATVVLATEPGGLTRFQF